MDVGCGSGMWGEEVGVRLQPGGRGAWVLVERASDFLEGEESRHFQL